MSNLRRIGTYRSKWGEGPLFHRDVLLYVDIEGHRVISYDPSDRSETIVEVGERVGTVVPREQGGLVIAGDTGFRFLDTDGNLTDIADPEPDIAANRFNDGKCDPSGRFWAGTISTTKETGTANLYRLDTDLSVSRQVTGVTNSNGICWTDDRQTMYYIDTPRKSVLAFDYDDATGDVTNARMAIDTQNFEGAPDGMAMDVQGNLWIAFCRGSAVRCFSPETGSELATIEVPTSCPTAPAFGGEHYDQLFITTGHLSDDPCENAGHVFRADPGVAGQRPNTFAG